jgi:hypothetical protein
VPPQQVCGRAPLLAFSRKNQTRETFEKEEDAPAASSTRVELDAVVGRVQMLDPDHGHVLEARRL